MKRILLILSLSLAVLPSVAGNGDKFFNLSAGWQWKNTVNAIIGFEAETKYHNAWEMYVDLSTAYEKCPQHGTVDSKSFWAYKTFGIGGAYKPLIYRVKIQH